MVRTQADPVAQWLIVAIIFLVVVALFGVIYLLVAGVVVPSTPRTLVESQLALLRNAAATEPGSGSARNAYILALEASGQQDAAMSEYTKALKQVSGGEQTQVYAAGVTLLFDQKDYKGVIALAKQAIGADDAAVNAVIAENAKKGITVTSAQFDHAARISILLTAARASGATADWKTAVQRLTEGLSDDPQAADLLTFRASAYSHLGDREKAIADYKQALTFIPDYAPALYGLKQLQGK